MRTPIGTATLSQEQTFDERGFACAAWWQKVRCQPQTVPLYLSDEIGTHTLCYGFDGVVVDADFTSHFGGVPFGHYDKSSHVGHAAKHTCFPYAYAVLDEAVNHGQGPGGGIQLSIDEQLVALLAHEFDHGEHGRIKTHFRLVPRSKLQGVLMAWKQVPEYLNLREMPIPPCFLKEQNGI
jgi:hypothetical protein